MNIPLSELKEFLDEKSVLYNKPKFIDSDPISIPHQFSKKQDIEISGFLSATIAWGNRKSIIKNAQKLKYLQTLVIDQGDLWKYLLHHRLEKIDLEHLNILNPDRYLENYHIEYRFVH